MVSLKKERGKNKMTSVLVCEFLEAQEVTEFDNFPTPQEIQ